MAPSLTKVGMATLAYVSSAAALSVQQQGGCVPTTGYALEDEYKPSNFFDKFKFWTDADPSEGYITYQTRSNAEGLGLIETHENDVRIGVEYKKSWPSLGRESVRIQGIDEYDGGLFIADFSHFPKPVCGAWPAFWMYGPTWPNDGEMDLYEGWHDPGYNHITGHTFDDVAGDCKLQPTLYEGSTVNTNCDVNSNQYYNEGCGVQETNGQWGKSSGGVYAMEWTDDFIKVWSWGTAPSDVAAGKPVPTTWGKPHFAVTSATCNIGKAFKKMKFVFNVDICGQAPNGNWESSGCKAKTGKDECWHYAREAEAQQYKDVYFGVRGIKVYQMKTSICPAPSSALPSSSVPASSSVPVSSSVPASSAAPSSAAPSSAPASSAPASSAPASSAPVSSAPASSWSAPASSAPISSAPASSVPSGVSSSVPANSDSTSSEYCSDEPEPSSSVPSSVAPSATPSSTLPVNSVSSAAPVSSAPASSAPVSSAPASSAPVSSALPSSISVGPSVVTSVQWTTSTVYDCVTETISPCPPGATDCHVQVVTRTIATSTTVCPVTITSTPAPTSWPHNGGWTTSTVYSTKTYTISKCAPTVTNCPYGHVTTEIVPVSTTVCPVTDKWTVVSKPTGGAPNPGHGGWPAPGGGEANPGKGGWPAPGGGEATYPAGGSGAAPTKGSGLPAPSGGSGSYPGGGSGSYPSSGAGSKPAGSPSYNGTYTGSKPVTAGSAKVGGSIVAVLAAAMMVMGL